MKVKVKHRYIEFGVPVPRRSAENTASLVARSDESRQFWEKNNDSGGGFGRGEEMSQSPLYHRHPYLLPATLLQKSLPSSQISSQLSSLENPKHNGPIELCPAMPNLLLLNLLDDGELGVAD
nr:hypothetical protein Iba_chr02dCG2610 [Ipomoea batatas]